MPYTALSLNGTPGGQHTFIAKDSFIEVTSPGTDYTPTEERAEYTIFLTRTEYTINTTRTEYTLEKP